MRDGTPGSWKARGRPPGGRGATIQDVSSAVFRIPAYALLAAGLALICVTPVAWAAPGLQALYLLPLGFAAWVVRNRTTVDGERLVARSTFGRRVVPWSDVKAIKVDPKGWLSAVLADGSLVRLPAVRVAHLPTLSVVSGGRVPDPSAAPAAGEDADGEAGATAESTESGESSAESTESASTAAESTESAEPAASAGAAKAPGPVVSDQGSTEPDPNATPPAVKSGE